MQREKTKILFVYPSKSPFICNGFHILRKHYSVKPIHTNFSKKSLMPNIKSFFQILFGMIWADIAFCWFADFHSFIAVHFARLLQKKAVVIVGGYEIVTISDIEYGAHLDRKRSKRFQSILNNADRIITVSEYLKNEIYKQYPIRKNIHVIYNSIDTDFFRPSGKKDPLIITVCLLKKQNIPIKGLLTFIEVAKNLPHLSFKIIGDDIDGTAAYLKSIAPSNVEIHEYQSQESVLAWYQKASVYCQLSRIESFGVSLVEAMACECFPIVTDKGALPEVIDHTGYIVTYGDSNETIERIIEAITKERRDTRKRVENFFSNKVRENCLLTILDKG